MHSELSPRSHQVWSYSSSALKMCPKLGKARTLTKVLTRIDFQKCLASLSTTGAPPGECSRHSAKGTPSPHLLVPQPQGPYDVLQANLLQQMPVMKRVPQPLYMLNLHPQTSMHSALAR